MPTMGKRSGGKKGGKSPTYSPTYGTGTGYRDAGANAFRYMPAAAYNPRYAGIMPEQYMPGASPLTLPMWQPTITTAPTPGTVTNTNPKGNTTGTAAAYNPRYVGIVPEQIIKPKEKAAPGYMTEGEYNPDWFYGLGDNYGMTWNKEQKGWELPTYNEEGQFGEGWYNTRNRWGQPTWTPGPIQVTGPRGPGYATGTTPITADNLNQQYTATNNYLANWQPRGRSGSVASFLNYRQRDRLKRRQGMLEALAKANNIDLGGGGQGIAPAWTGVMANWRV